jgi:DNA-binding HxlR family transcriptional regulator
MSRRYRLLCPIARALDRVGDRWTLLILRDLHAGPARFVDLQAALPGLAPNLLTTRLRQLEEDALICRRKTELSVRVYELTPTGARSSELLFELAMFGAIFPPDEEVRRPGNLRLVAVTLKTACQRVVDPDLSLRAELVMGKERFELQASEGNVDIRYRAATDPEVVISIDYEASIAVADGQLSMQEFRANHVKVLAGKPALAESLWKLLAAAMEHMAT